MRSISAKTGRRWGLASSRCWMACRTYWSGIGGQAEGGAFVADVAAVVDVVVVVVAGAFFPVAFVGGVFADGAPAGAFEGGGEGEAVAFGELVVAALGADPDPGLGGDVRQPAEPAEGGGGQEAAAGGEPVGVKLRGAVVEDAVDGGGEGGVLDGDAGRSFRRTAAGRLCRAARSAAGSGGVCAEAVAGDLAGEDVVRAQPALHRLHLADDERGGAGRGGRRPRDAQDDPQHGEHGGGAAAPGGGGRRRQR